MKKELEEYITKYGLSAALMLIGDICEERAASLQDRDPKRAKRWQAAEIKVYQLAGKKFIQPL